MQMTGAISPRQVRTAMFRWASRHGWGAQRLTLGWKYSLDDWFGPGRAQASLYVRRDGALDPDRRAARGPSDAGRHIPRNPHPRHRRGLAVHRPAARPDVGPRDAEFPALAHHHRQRHRAYRGHVLYRRRHREGVLPAGRRHQHRQCPGHRDRADRAAADAAQHHAAADPELQRRHRADHPAGAGRQGRLGTGRVRPGHQHGAHAAGDGAGRGHSIPLRRQVPADPDRPRPGGSAGARPVGRRRRQCTGGAESADAGRHPEDRRPRVRDPAQQRPGRLQRPGGYPRVCRQRHGRLPARRGAGARRQPAAAEHRPCRWRAVGAAGGAEERRHFDAGDHRRHQGAR